MGDMQTKNYEKVLMVISLVILLVLLLPACEPIAPIKVQNNTDQNLTIFINGINIGDVAPGGEIRNRKELIVDRYKIEAKNSQGQTLYKQERTYEDMKKMDWKVVIPPPPE
jgi:hypothetical protein